MRVLQISHNFHTVGGSDSVFFATSDLLSDAGHEVIPFCAGSPDDKPGQWNAFFPKCANTGTPKARDALRYFYNREARDKLKRLLDQCGPVDVAHLHIYHGKQTPSILSALRQRGIPVVQSLHEYKLACPTYTLHRDGQNCEACVQGSDLNAIRHRCKDGSLVKSAVMVAEKKTSRMLGDVRHIDRFLCVSDFQRRLMARAGLPSNKLATLHNFVDTNVFRSEPGHDGYLLYFGRVETLKGLPTLIDAVARTGHRLIIAGDGSWRREMENRINGNPNIRYVGFKMGADLKRLIGRSLAVVVPSEWYENCPMTVLEAKAMGRPVIGAATGGIPELIRPGSDGYLFKPGSVDGLCRALSDLDKAKFRDLSQNAREDIENRFSAQAYRQELLGHYAEVRRATTVMSPTSASLA